MTPNRPQFQHKTGRRQEPAAGSGKGGKPAAAGRFRPPIKVRGIDATAGFPEYGILRS
jgi:hypothetical protein